MSPAGFLQALADHGRPGRIGFCRLNRVLCPDIFGSLKVHGGSGQMLGQAIVDLVADQSPLVVAGLQQVLEGLPLALQGCLGLNALLHFLVKLFHRSGQLRPRVPTSHGRLAATLPGTCDA